MLYIWNVCQEFCSTLIFLQNSLGQKMMLTLNRHIPDLVHSWQRLSYTVNKAGSLSVLLSLVTETK